MSNLYIPVSDHIMRVIVPGQPVSTNAMYQRNQHGFHLSTAATEWKDAVGQQVRLWRCDHPIQFPRHLIVLVTVWGVKGDCDNYLKATLDGLKVAIGVDDRYYTPMADRCTGFADSGAIITVWEGSGARVEAWPPQSLVYSQDVYDTAKKIGVSPARAYWLLQSPEVRDALAPR
jgi:Holliday junction resolvase RusA-like endonuclease